MKKVRKAVIPQGWEQDFYQQQKQSLKKCYLLLTNQRFNSLLKKHPVHDGCFYTFGKKRIINSQNCCQKWK